MAVWPSHDGRQSVQKACVKTVKGGILFYFSYLLESWLSCQKACHCGSFGEDGMHAEDCLCLAPRRRKQAHFCTVMLPYKSG